MTIKVNFSAGSYAAADLNNEFSGLFADGVLTGGAVVEHNPANLSINVASVKGIKSGLFLYSDTTENVAITSNTSGYGRIDTIAMNMDNGAIVAVAGTPSSSPTAPILTGNKIALANIAVGNNVSVINNANITDVRSYSFYQTLTDHTLINSYAAQGSPGGVKTSKNNGVVSLSISLTVGTATAGTTITTLPWNKCPLQTMIIPVYNVTSAGVGYLRLDTAGVLSILSGATSGQVIKGATTFMASAN
jgi:hypothetical protein